MVGFLHWALRCSPALTALALIGLNFLALADLSWWARLLGWGAHSGSRALHSRKADHWNSLHVCWVIYAVLLHAAVLNYNCRLCYAIIRTTARIKRAAEDDARSESNEMASLHDSAVTHVIMLPAYKEDMETLQETLNVLACHDQARACYDMYLAMEQKDPDAKPVAEELMRQYTNRFRSIQYTVHPHGIPGESPGKSSNISWAAKQVSQKYHDSKSRHNVVLTVMDADTHLMPSYFRQCTRLHLDDPEGISHTIYAPPVIFDRNAHLVPCFVRMADMLWSSATISGLFPGSVIGTPTSVYSVPLLLADRVGGWDTHAGAIGEDLHMMVKCFFATRGALIVKTVYSPASQCNVCSDRDGLSGYLDSLRARWRQAIRHMWGSLDSGYSIERGLELASSAPSSQALLPYSTAPFAQEKWTSPDAYGDEPRSSLLARLVPLYHRMFEAHFVPIHLTLILVASTAYTLSVPPVATPFLLAFTFTITGWARALAFLLTVCAFCFFERYHALSVELRERAMRRAGLDASLTFSRRGSWRFYADYLLFPVAGILFGSIPALKAQISHLWTEDLVYVVSAKPKRIVVDGGQVLEFAADGRLEKVLS